MLGPRREWHEAHQLRRHERTGRLLDGKGFVEKLERLLGRPLKRGKAEPKRLETDN